MERKYLLYIHLPAVGGFVEFDFPAVVEFFEVEDCVLGDSDADFPCLFPIIAEDFYLLLDLRFR
jgi:hypothetical protein